MDAWQKIVDRLNLMPHLMPDWDGHMGLPPEIIAIERALMFCGIAMNSGWPAPRSCVPAENRSVILAWFAEHRNLEVEIVAHGRAKFSLVDLVTGDVQFTELDQF